MDKNELISFDGSFCRVSWLHIGKSIFPFIVFWNEKIKMTLTFLFVLETCLGHENHTFERTLFADTTDDSAERTLIAV